MTPQKKAYAKSVLQRMAGQTFGSWKVLKQNRRDKHGKTQWLCRCICGKEKFVGRSDLIRGHSKSCGCAANNLVQDLVGKIFERWTVLKRAKSGKNGKTKWLCRCICGTKKAVLGHSLRRGHSKSCGCLTKEKMRLVVQQSRFWLHAHNKMGVGVAAMKKLIRGYQGRAKEFGRSWSLTEDQAKDLFEGKCHYCGCLPNQCSRRKNANGEYLYNGIDRVDNSIGYEPGNVVSCCKRCNFSKGDMSYTEFSLWIEQVYSHHIIGGAPAPGAAASPAPPPSGAPSGTSCGCANWPAAG